MLWILSIHEIAEELSQIEDFNEIFQNTNEDNFDFGCEEMGLPYLFSLLNSQNTTTLRNTMINQVQGIGISTEQQKKTWQINWYFANDPMVSIYLATLRNPALVSNYQTSPGLLYGSTFTQSMENYFIKIKTIFGQSMFDQLVTEFAQQSNLYVDEIKVDEFHIYGSSRLGVYEANRLISKRVARDINLDNQITNNEYVIETPEEVTYLFSSYQLERGAKRYELANHLGNVLTVISDKKTAICTGNTFNYFAAERISATDYSPFGAPLAGRTWNGGEYRFGFNSMEKDNEINGTGNAYDFGARIYDGRLGRFLSIDPLFKRFSNESNFIFAGCSPIAMVDLLGKAKTYYIITIALDGSRKTKIVKEKYEVIKEEIEETQELGLGANNPVFTETRNFDVVQIVIIDERTNTITSKQPFKSKERTSSKVLNDLQDDLEMLQSMESKDGVMWYSKTGQGQETKKGKNAEMENIDLLLDALNSVQSAAGNKGGEIIFKFKDDSKTVIEQMKVTLDGNDLMDKVTNFNALKEFGHFVRGHKYDSCTSCGYVGPCGFKHNEEKIVPAKGDYDAKK